MRTVETDASRSQKLQGFRAYVLGAAGLLAPSNRRRQLLLLNRAAPARRIVNGQEVLDVLQGVANGWGEVHAFQETNTMPFHQLIDALRVCAVAIGPQGKAVANAIFLPPGAVMVELMPEEEESNELAKVLGLLRVAHLGFPAQLGIHARKRGNLLCHSKWATRRAPGACRPQRNQVRPDAADSKRVADGRGCGLRGCAPTRAVEGNPNGRPSTPLCNEPGCGFRSLRTRTKLVGSCAIIGSTTPKSLISEIHRGGPTSSA